MEQEREPTSETAPEYYSKAAIYGFSFFFSAILGTILMVANLKKSGSKKGILPVAAFGILYTALIIVVGSHFSATTGWGAVTGALGGYVLNTVFWKKYLGDGSYRKRSIWIPLAICLVIFTALLVLIILGQKSGS